jgi:glutamyl-tRNA reductase
MTDPVQIAIAGINHQSSDIATLEKFRFPDEAALLADAGTRFRGAILLQTCNRVEMLVEGSRDELTEFLGEKGKSGFFVLEGQEALGHLFSLAAGIESMIVGEDQILGQLKKALAASHEAKVSSSFLDLCINKAVHVGIEVRKRTTINRGAVSVGSAAVLLAESQIGSLEGRHILVVGSGDMGLLVAQALAARNLTAMYVANRTYQRAVILAEKIGGKAVHFDDLYHYVTLSDVVISCTSAPHPVIHAAELERVMKDRLWPVEGHPRPLILIDIAQPRDVEEGAGEIDGVRLFTIDSLRSVNEETMSARKEEANRARQYVAEELGHFIRHLSRLNADNVLATLHTWADAIRTRERDRALLRLGVADPTIVSIIDDLSRVLAGKILADATSAIRAHAERGDLASAEALASALTGGSIREKDE